MATSPMLDFVISRNAFAITYTDEGDCLLEARKLAATYKHTENRLNIETTLRHIQTFIYIDSNVHGLRGSEEFH